MASDIQVRKVTQDVMLFVWLKNKVITKEPSPDLGFIPKISAQLFNNLSISVWIESFRNAFVWKHFVCNHFERMTTSPYMFANYVAYAFYILENNTNAYEILLDVLSLVTYFGLYCWQRERELFLNACVDLFCAFFEKTIRSRFVKQGGWEHFNEFLEDFTLKKYRSLICDDESPSKYFKTLGDEHRQSDELTYIINRVIIGCVTLREVETDKRAIKFAKSITGKVIELCTKNLEEILEIFARIDRQVKEHYRQMAGETSDGIARQIENFPPQKFETEASKNIPSKTKSDKKQQKIQTVTISHPSEIQNFHSMNCQDIDASVKESPKSRTLERAISLLGDIAKDILKLSDINQSLCEEYGEPTQ